MESLGKKVSSDRCQAIILVHARQHHKDHVGEGFVEEDHNISPLTYFVKSGKFCTQ